MGAKLPNRQETTVSTQDRASKRLPRGEARGLEQGLMQDREMNDKQWTPPRNGFTQDP